MDTAQLVAEETRLIQLLDEPYILIDEKKEAVIIDQLNDVQARIFDLQEDCIRSYGHTVGSLLATC